jgi:hypothetical protein
MSRGMISCQINQKIGINHLGIVDFVLGSIFLMFLIKNIVVIIVINPNIVTIVLNLIKDVAIGVLWSMYLLLLVRSIVVKFVLS